MDFLSSPEDTLGTDPRPQAIIPRLHSTTAGGSDSQGFASWQPTIGTLFESTVLDGQDFAACMTVYHFNRFLFCSGRLDGARYLRDSVRLGWCDLDHYLIHLPLQRGLVAGTGLRVRPADVVVVDLAQAADFRMASGVGVTLLVPRTALSPLLADERQLHGLVLRRESAAGGFLGSLLTSLSTAAPLLAMDEALQFTQPVLALVAACIGSMASRVAGTGAAGLGNLGRRGRLYIEQNLHREDLAPKVLARELGVSRSQLYRAFDKLGGVCHYLRQRRLRRCLLALCEAGNSGRRIVDLACEHGFADEAHFSRVFRQAFGLSPRAARTAMQRRDPSVFCPWATQKGDGPAFAHWVRELTSC